MKKTVLFVTGLAATTAAILAPLSPSWAEKGSWPDPAGDMVRVADDNTESPAPNRANGDLTRLHANHTRDALVMRLRFRELRRTGECLQVSGSLRTDQTRARGYDEGFYVNAGPSCDDPGTGTWMPRLEMDSYFGSGPTAFIDYGDNLIGIRIPRTALDRPRWLKVNISRISQQTGPAGDYNRFVDTHDLGWTPRLHRGS